MKFGLHVTETRSTLTLHPETEAEKVVLRFVNEHRAVKVFVTKTDAGTPIPRNEVRLVMEKPPKILCENCKSDNWTARTYSGTTSYACGNCHHEWREDG